MSSKKIKRTRHNERPSIPEFFEGKNVFITGATGFMGKVLVEKLLRSCPDVNKIYILMRPKNGKNLEERLKAMTSLPLFVKCKRENINLNEKIIPIRGDVSEIRLGLSEQDIELLEKEISVVFHVAASVRFDDPLKKSTMMNTRATVELVKLATGMEKLQSFVHVSTTYCNTHKSVIEEKIYPAPADWRNVVKLAENLDDYTLEVFSQKILNIYPNTYTFTKGLAEHVVYDYKDYIPAAIFRPSIVVSSMQEPMPGWVDNFNGPVGLIVASGKGIVRSVYSDPNIRSDFMPVDMAVKAMIAVAWERATRPEPFSEPPVYNCSSHDIKSITQKELVEIGHYVTSEIPLNDMLWLPGGNVTKSKLLHFLRVIFFHLVPALIIDSMLTMSNRKPILMRLHRKIYVANLALEYFITRQWAFKNEKLKSLNDKLLEEDKAAFGYIVDDVDVIEYFRNCTYGAREYLLKEDNTELPEAKKHYKKMYWIDKAAKATFVLLLGGAAVRLKVIHGLSYLLRILYTLLLQF